MSAVKSAIELQANGLTVRLSFSLQHPASSGPLFEGLSADDAAAAAFAGLTQLASIAAAASPALHSAFQQAHSVLERSSLLQVGEQLDALRTGHGSEKSGLNPPAIGTPWAGQGGIYLGECGDEHLILVTTAESNFLSVWGTYDQNILGAQSRTDGRANTAAMAAAGCECAVRVLAMEADGHKDLFIPSQAQLQHAYAVAPDLFDKEGYHWSSTQVSRSGAFVQDFEYGNSYWDVKGSSRRVRAFRAIPLQPLST